MAFRPALLMAVAACLLMAPARGRNLKQATTEVGCLHFVDRAALEPHLTCRTHMYVHVCRRGRPPSSSLASSRGA